MATTKRTRRRKRSAMQAAIEVMQASDRPMKAAEVADVVLEKRMAPNLKGQTPKATITRAIYGAANAGKVQRLKGGKFKVARDVVLDTAEVQGRR
jgi:hypothetical protein